MQRLFDVGEATLNLRYDLDKIVDIQPPASGASHHRDAARAQAERLHNFPGAANFFLRLSGQRNANRVADALMKKYAQTNRGLYRACEGRAGFGDAEVKRIVDFLSQQAIGSNGAMHVGCFQRNDDVGEIEIFKNLYVAHRRFDHRFRRRRAVLLQKIFFQRTAVDADANRDFLRLGGAYDFDNALVLADVAGIQTKFVDARVQRHQSEFVMKVDVGDQRNLRRALADFFKSDGRVVVRHCEPDDFATSADHLFNLCDGRTDVCRVSLGH